ncbi:hypothetical protein BO94DRAFT_549357 [Aspergillus sclerotioniger CBS 115572]|uniref:Protein kinase domain-containing protein n=1 Tax=Aspergillus sclerotioniger CBS 115572 TaxID=1450535 RepID=A0A317VQ37_9EURO|nr:hypothetical protein BO94DRAFT_549357 [Aspergillus sclerotioniger CBS 115572]PWY76045.1 hypothetical protein BO94DRAFT_549357 [Aspergillus sclerotioniger CBS 115572]
MTPILLLEISFIQEIKNSPFSCGFRVRWHEKECILNVYHSTEPSPADPPYREINLFKCESTAFMRLQERGLCNRGYVPEFYGLIEHIKPADHLPYLKDFLGDNPNAILLEYVPDIRPISLAKFSRERSYKLRSILSEIHDAGIIHGDTYPRNIMVQESSDRVLWVDFDRAQTFTPQSMNQRHKNWLEEEADMMDYFVKALTLDAKNGRIYYTWLCYYEYVSSIAVLQASGNPPPSDQGGPACQEEVFE